MSRLTEETWKSLAAVATEASDGVLQDSKEKRGQPGEKPDVRLYGSVSFILTSASEK